MAARGVAAVLLLGAAPHATRAAVEVRLDSGRVLRGERAERQGDVVLLVLSSGTMRLDASHVVSIVETGAESAARLNVVGGESAPASGTARGAAIVAAIEGPAVNRVPAIAESLRKGDVAAAARRLGEAGVAATPLERVALGELQLRLSRAAEAAATLGAVPERELDLPARRARALALAEALSRLGRAGEALALLERTPDAEDGRVARARAELAPDADLAGRPLASSVHFDVVAPPGTRALSMGPVLDELESAHEMLRVALGGAPEDRIVVLLYPGTEFWDATGQQQNVGALFDGKVRIPVSRIDPPTPLLRAAIRHEVTHAFVEALSAGHADVRWHEGLAEHFEGTDSTATERSLAKGLREAPAAWPPPVSHATSHARMEWFLRRWGMPGARDVVAGMASRGTIDAAARAVTGLDEAGLDEAWRQDLLQGTR